MDETNEKIDAKLSEQDRADLEAMGIDPDADPDGEQVSLLRMWSEVLGNVEAVKDQPIPMGVAARTVASWPQLSFQDCARYHELYHDLLLDVRAILTETINDNPGCADFMEKDDAEENFEIYKALVITWNVMLDEREREWRAEDPESHIQFAALVDVRGMLFSRNGFAGHLEARGITFDSDEIAEHILAARGEQ